MTWTIDGAQGFESSKIAAFIVPYTRGRVLDVGCGVRKAWPHFIGVDNGHHWGPGAADVMIKDAADLSLFANASCDAVFSSHLLEHIEDTRAALSEWWRVIKPGGHLCLYLPHKELYPNIGQEGANPDHKHDFLPKDIGRLMDEIVKAENGHATMLEDEVRDGANEYSFFQVYRKDNSAQIKRVHDLGVNGQKLKGPYCAVELWDRNPGDRARVLVIRFGAIGDQIQAASVLPLLKEQGCHLTYMTTPEAQQVLLHNPSIDEWLIQDKDQVPNNELGAYIETISTRYDRVINFSESIEGALLVLPGRTNHTWTPEARRKILGTVNYQERMHDLAGVPYRFAPRFHPTDDERREAMAYKSTLGGPVVFWAIGGSSVHKIYPFTNVVIAWLLKRADAHIVLCGGQGEVELEAGLCAHLTEYGADMSRVHQTTGKWDIRRSLTFVEYADVVVGPETGILNAASHLDVPKVVMLSHSSRENLTKHWKRAITLEPDKARTPCFPCHTLHYGWDHCVKVKETQAALCASNIKPEIVYKAIELALKRNQAVESVAASFGGPSPNSSLYIGHFPLTDSQSPEEQASRGAPVEPEPRLPRQASAR